FPSACARSPLPFRFDMSASPPRSVLSSSRGNSVTRRLPCGARLGDVLVWLAAFPLLSCAAAHQPDSQSSRPHPPFERAQAAFMSHDFVAADSAFRAVLVEDTVSAHRRQAATTVAAIAWRVREDTGSAARVLTVAAATSGERFDALNERSRMLRVLGDYAGAREAAAQAGSAATTEAEQDDATTAWAEAVITPLLHQRLGRAAAPRWGSGPGDRAFPDSSALYQALVRLDSIVQRSPGGLNAGRLLILAGALSDD